MPDKEKLIAVFGEQFANEYLAKVATKRAEREKMTEEQARDIIAHVAEEGFDGDDPRMEIDKNTVMLLETPNSEEAFQKQTRVMETGAVSISMLFQGEWVSCMFNDPDMSKKVIPGEYYIGVGRYYEKEVEEGVVYLNLNMRGIVSLEEFQKMVDNRSAKKDVDVSPFFGSVE